MKAVVWTELLQASDLPHRRHLGAADRGHLVPGGWRRSLGRRAPPERLQRARSPTRASISRTRCSPDDRRRVSLDGVARSRSAHRATTAVVAVAQGSQAAIIGSGVVVILQFALFLMHRAGPLGVLQRPSVPDPRPDLPDVHHRSHAAWAAGPDARRDPRGDDEHAFRRDQLAGRQRRRTTSTCRSLDEARRRDIRCASARSSP